MLYVVFDGRANIDIDDAEIMEYMGEMKPEEAYKQFWNEYRETDNVLVEYDIIDDEAFNPVIVPQEEIKTALQKKRRPV